MSRKAEGRGKLVRNEAPLKAWEGLERFLGERSYTRNGYFLEPEDSVIRHYESDSLPEYHTCTLETKILGSDLGKVTHGDGDLAGKDTWRKWRELTKILSENESNEYPVFIPDEIYQLIGENEREAVRIVDDYGEEHGATLYPWEKFDQLRQTDRFREFWNSNTDIEGHESYQNLDQWPDSIHENVGIVPYHTGGGLEYESMAICIINEKGRFAVEGRELPYEGNLDGGGRKVRK